MSKRRITVILLILFFAVGIFNSYDARGIEELSYVIAIGLDKSETDENNILITIQVASSNPSASGSTSLKTHLYSVDTKSIATGFKILNTLTTNEINLSHCYAIVMSEEFAKSGINPYFDNLADNVEIRSTCNIIVSNNTAQKFLEATSNSDEISAKYYNAFLGSAQTTSYIAKSTLFDFYSKMHDSVQSPVAIYGYTDGKDILDLGMCVFKEDKAIGRLNGIETIMYNIINNDLESATISIKSPLDSSVILDVAITLNKKTQIKVLPKRDVPIVKCNLVLNGKVLSVSSKNKYLEEVDLKILEEAICNKVNHEMNLYLNKISKDFNSDINGFYGYLKRNYKSYNEMNNIDWNESFKKAKFIVNTQILLTSNHLFPKY